MCGFTVANQTTTARANRDAVRVFRLPSITLYLLGERLVRYDTLKFLIGDVTSCRHPHYPDWVAASESPSAARNHGWIFCGCVTTASIWVLELSNSRRRHAYVCCGTSVVVPLALVVEIGSLRSTSGFTAPACFV